MAISLFDYFEISGKLGHRIQKMGFGSLGLVKKTLKFLIFEAESIHRNNSTTFLKKVFFPEFRAYPAIRFPINRVRFNLVPI